MLFVKMMVPVVATVVSGQCANRKVRQEWHAMSEGQQQQWAGCIQALYEQGTWAYFEQKHAQMRQAGHNNPYFILFHRALLAELEDAMEGVGCGFGIPYFDSGSVYNHLMEDPAWNTLGDTSGCIQSGPLAGLTLASGECVNRNPDGRTVWASVTIRSAIESSETYGAFTSSCENGPHAQVHNAIGGCMADLYKASGDPIFFLHHCYVDYLYANWQAIGDRYYDIGNQNPDTPAPAYEDQYTLGMLADYQNNLCYTYGQDTPDVAVPDDQLTEDAVIEEPPELSEEVRESFNLDEEAVKNVHQNLSDLTTKIHEYLKEGKGNVGDLWDMFKEKVKAVNGDDDDTNTDSNQASPSVDSAATSTTLTLGTAALVAVAYLL